MLPSKLRRLDGDRAEMANLTSREWKVLTRNQRPDQPTHAHLLEGSQNPEDLAKKHVQGGVAKSIRGITLAEIVTYWKACNRIVGSKFATLLRWPTEHWFWRPSFLLLASGKRRRQFLVSFGRDGKRSLSAGR